jgi:hypothetical protein
MAGTVDSDFYDETAPRRRWPWLMLGLIVVFVGGMVAMGYLLKHNGRAAAWLNLVPGETAARQVENARQIAFAMLPPPPPPAHAPTRRDAAETADLAGRVAALNDKVTSIETQARAATGDASRAEGLLVAFAARRALDRGIPLGYIEGLLRQRFGHNQPEAVATILSAARQPVTLADLQNGLDAIGPTLAADGDSPHESWWQSFRRELSGMVVIRRAGQPSPLPADRVARAERMLEAGQVDGALAEVLRLANHAPAEPWVASARRYLAGRGALDRIETAALLEPGTPATPPPQMPPSPSE